MPGKHSVIVGGSSAAAMIFCPANYQETLRLPDTMAESTESEYAAEGTAMHAVMEVLFGPKGESLQPRDLIGEHFYDRRLTLEHVETMIEPALDLIDELCAAYPDGGEYFVLGTEAEVTFPDIPGAFGSLDLRLANDEHVLMIDYKFGAGVGVKAVYSDPALGDYVNPQLSYYATAALNTLPAADFKGKKLVLAIIQPREPTGAALTHTIVDRKELKAFKEALVDAVIEALGRKPHRERGEHCRFRPCKATCPLWTGPLLDAAALGVVKPTQPEAGKVTSFGQYLADAKGLLDTVAPLKKEIDAQIHAYLEAGGVVPGWRLKDQVPDRKWLAPEVVAPKLLGLGLKEDEVYQPKKLQTFKVVDAAAKKLGVEIPADLRPRPPSSGTTVCPVDDAAPPANRGAALTAFGQSLRALIGNAGMIEAKNTRAE